MAASAGPLQLERDPTFAAVLRMRQDATGGATRQRPIEARISQWQSTAGNAAVARALQRQTAPDEGPAGAGGGGAPTKTHSKLQYGARGDEVQELQQRLNDLKATQVPIAIDGIFGRKTQAAVRTYQEDHPPLGVDGDAGPETWAALDKGEQGTAGKTEATERDPFEAGTEQYNAGRFGRAYDEFTKAWEQTGEHEHLWNRAQALRRLGGRREDAIALYQQLVDSDAPNEVKVRAREQIAGLRGPGKTGDEKKDSGAAFEIFEAGQKLYAEEKYGPAYDEFTKAWEITREPAMLYNRAQALRLLGGRRAETINLYEAVIVTDIPDEQKKAAAREIADLRGPGSRPDEKANQTAAEVEYQKGLKHFHDEEYAQAYDAFSKAHEITGDPAYLYNRAQSLRLLGGRRSFAISLFEQFIASNVSEDERKAARAHLEDLKGSDRKKGAESSPPPS